MSSKDTMAFRAQGNATACEELEENEEEDHRDGFVYFGCKNSVKIAQSNIAPEMTSI